MASVPRREKKLSIEPLEDRTTPSGVKLPDPSTYAAGQVLFSIAAGADRNQTLTALAASPWGLTAKELGFGVFKLTLNPGVTVQQAMDGLSGTARPRSISARAWSPRTPRARTA